MGWMQTVRGVRKLLEMIEALETNLRLHGSHKIVGSSLAAIRNQVSPTIPRVSSKTFPVTHTLADLGHGEAAIIAGCFDHADIQGETGAGDGAVGGRTVMIAAAVHCRGDSDLTTMDVV
eukprot:760896-Hanusia_phi.AAC.2